MKKTWVLICIIMLFFSAYIIADTYAKYITGATATASKQAGAWVIEVNDTDISNSRIKYNIYYRYFNLSR